MTLREGLEHWRDNSPEPDTEVLTSGELAQIRKEAIKSHYERLEEELRRLVKHGYDLEHLLFEDEWNGTTRTTTIKIDPSMEFTEDVEAEDLLTYGTLQEIIDDKIERYDGCVESGIISRRERDNKALALGALLNLVQRRIRATKEDASNAQVYTLPAEQYLGAAKGRIREITRREKGAHTVVELYDDEELGEALAALAPGAEIEAHYLKSEE